MNSPAAVDERHMRRALELAERGRGLTSPGAMVGAVIVGRGKVLGEGYYTWDGVDHAEVIALRGAGAGARGSTLYVTLEPCSHQGRTPPCVDAIIAAGVARVVAATEDPFPKVNGRGLASLRSAGIEVECGLLAAEARRVNEAFLISVRENRPFGILKVAMSLDGKIATASGESRWITSEAARARAHELRHLADAILTGSGTILADDPALTDRSGRPRRRPLLRAVIDRRGRLRQGHKILAPPGALVYTNSRQLRLPAPSEVVVGTIELAEIARDLAHRDVQTLMLECGPDLAFDAVRRGIIDKIVAFVAPILIGGREIPAFGSVGARTLSEAARIDDWRVEPVGPDLMITGYVHRNR